MSMLEEMNQVEGAKFDPMLAMPEQQPFEPMVRPPLFDFSKLKAPTGSGHLEEYKTHPLNWNGSKPVARIIRGFSGLLGELNFAVIDIIIGFFELSNEKSKERKTDDDIRGNANIS